MSKLNNSICKITAVRFLIAFSLSCCFSLSIYASPEYGECNRIESTKNLSWCKEIIEIDKNKNYDVFRKDILDESSEGGEISVFLKNKRVIKISLSYYGDMGFIEQTLYKLKDQSKLYAITDVDYDKPFYINGYKRIKEDFFFVYQKENASPLTYKSNKLSKFSINKAVEEIEKDLKKHSEFIQSSTRISEPSIKLVNQYVNSIKKQIKAKKLEVISTVSGNIEYQFHYNEDQIKRCKISINHGKYTHSFYYYYNEMGNILKYLKVTKADEELKNQLDLSRRAIIYKNSGEVIWKNAMFDPPVEHFNIIKLFYYLKKSHQRILSF